MPDNIKYFESKNGRKYFATSNEGDSKDFDESRVKNLKLDSSIFGNITELQMDDHLGRLKVINQMGYNSDSGVYTDLYTFSSRDFTIFEVTNTESTPIIKEVFSSESDFETIIADELGEDGFNCNAFNPSFDSRSDDKGPEPECITVGKCGNGRLYVFIGLERVGGIMVYDATYIDDGIVSFVEYINNRDFNITISKNERAPEMAGDFGPEQLRFIDESVYGVPLLVVANAESASVTMYRINCEEIPIINNTMSNVFINSTTIESDEMYSTASPTEPISMDNNTNTEKTLLIPLLSAGIVLVIIFICCLYCRQRHVSMARKSNDERIESTNKKTEVHITSTSEAPQYDIDTFGDAVYGVPMLTEHQHILNDGDNDIMHDTTMETMHPNNEMVTIQKQ